MVVVFDVKWHFSADQPLNVPQVGALVFFVEKRNRDAFRSGAPCSANPVHIGLRDIGDFEVHHVA